MTERKTEQSLIAIAAVVGLVLSVASVAWAQVPPSNKDELKCQAGVSKSLSKFSQKKAQCARKCLKQARKSSGPYTGCEPPDYTDPKTNACIFDSKKGAEAKAAAKMGKQCVADCPDCYVNGGICADFGPLVAYAEDNFDTIGPRIYCLEAAGTTPTKEEAKCEDTVEKTLAKFLGVKAKCYEKCIKKEFKDKIAANSCTAGAPTDVKTQDCIAKAEAKAAKAIDKVCADASANPSCFLPDYPSGADWVAVGENAVDTAAPLVYCTGLF
jgi:hypothetical protein